MIETVLTAALLGLLAGGVPGPYTTVVATTALESGFRPALKLAFIPLVTETPPLILTVFLLRNLNHDLLGAVGILGGVAIAWLGLRFYRRQVNEDTARVEVPRGTFRTLAVAGLLSPAPWIFWLVAAGPLFLRSWNASWMRGVVFAVILYAMFVGTAATIAWLASHGRRVMTPLARRRVLRVMGVLLILAGGVLVWQSIEGNFQEMVRRQEALRERVR